MIELPDDELDKLFRKSSEELDPTYEPDDWNDLRKRLDKQDGKTPAGWWRKWWPLGVLVLLIPVGIALYSLEGENGGKEEGGRSVALEGENGGKEEGGRGVALRGENGGSEEGAKDRERTEDGGSERGVVEEGGVSESGVVEESGRSSEVVGKSAEETTKKQAIVDNGNPSVDNERKLAAGVNEVARNGKADIKNELKTSENEAGKSSSKSELNAAVGNNGRNPLPRSQSKAGGVFLEPNRSKVEGGDGALSFKNNAKAAGGETSLPQAAGRPVATDESVTKADEPARTLISASALNSEGLKWNALQLPGITEPVYELPEPPAPPKRSSMSAEDQSLVAVRFGYSPDLSTVGLKDFSKPGTSVSLLVEYLVLPRLYLQSGAVWSRKDYYAPAEAYQLPKTAHVYLPKMTGIDGVCKILEVPVNLRYDIALKQRSRWFAGAGFSSYHMNSEKYKYYYVNPNDPNAVKYPGWNGKTGWYWLSHANVSAGYEYRISRKLSLLAEPSIRMPLKRVGYGKVNLITTGLWLSVRYTPVFK
ncbi:hypothetical protein J2Y45_000337 [Dyadobacter sp. BE34]|uniref:Outer membrane protein beta-barrel domain-containing protein n=1 Tax=Dyadobacter fermentans TaxID=94254 RepID=A0ABU1QPH7_9BACT|nr:MULTISPECIES: hypothetical protein [Dyadobacter]MDR6803067.1 hypothetical protein [Dyadobacter fermentans]MDR7040809.1 hypothetical protein [Dyadobacter sp. BE242]MDR7195211.1 hypothetical protein [Dyadobacter sp. BE34]MDR7214243.1 hypothetical protein [Dyadobacter sp. BE31]MDR7260619.1 hypothetical protein [Dyadobacter sp. BE32]